MNPSISNNIVVNSPGTTPKTTAIIEPTVTESSPGLSPPSCLPLSPSTSSASSFSPYPKFEPSCPSSSLTAPSANDSREIAFKLKLLSILQELISSDFSLIQNLIEVTKNIILHVDDLHSLISILCETNNIDIISKPKVSGCCSSASKVIYYEIERIVVNGFDLMIAYNNDYNPLRSNNISLDHVIPDVAI
jgi:hypothetical protein